MVVQRTSRSAGSLEQTLQQLEIGVLGRAKPLESHHFGGH
jgi:hypothetical protein